MNSIISTLFSWNSAVWVCLVFKKVEVMPYFFNRVMDGTVCTTAFRAEKYRSFLKIDSN